MGDPSHKRGTLCAFNYQRFFSGIIKTHNLAIIECETLQAVFSKDMSPNQLTAQAKYVSTDCSG